MSDSDYIQGVESLQLGNYAALVTIVVVAYDYLLTLSDEVHYVWRSWTWISTIFVVLRYIGLPATIISTISATTLMLPVTTEVSTATYFISLWSDPIFIGVVDLVMILRVYAMWNRSKKILYILLLLYIPQVIISFVFTGVFHSSGSYIQVTTYQFFDYSYCMLIVQDGNLVVPVSMLDNIPRFVLSIVLFVLAIAQTLKQSFDMYKATKQWRANKYLEQLATDGIFYFLVYVLWNINNTIAVSATEVMQTCQLILAMVSISLLTAMPPRFIISMRALYDRDLHRRWEGMDSGFGVVSQPAASTNPVMSAIAFVDVDLGQQQDDQVMKDDANDLEAIGLRGLENSAGVGKAENSMIALEDRACQV